MGYHLDMHLHQLSLRLVQPFLAPATTSIVLDSYQLSYHTSCHFNMLHLTKLAQLLKCTAAATSIHTLRQQILSE
jgi:hypothetical protein